VFPLLILLGGALAPAGQAALTPTSPQSVAAAQGQSSIAAKIRQYLEQFGGSYTKVSDTTWTVPYQGKSLKNYDVFVSTIPNSDLVLIGVPVATKKNLKPSQDLYLKLLRYNHVADSVKVGIDDEGDLFLRADLNGRTMDFQEFKEIVEQVAAATDELHGQIQSSLTPD
jgi:hypothetical protein